MTIHDLPTVTVGLPVRNHANSILDTLRSIFCQTFTDWEVIVIDDGSKDETSTLLKNIENPSVAVLENEYPRGLPSCLNQITKAARGEFIARIDADDLMAPLRLESQIAELRRYQEIQVVGSPAYCIDDYDRLLGITDDSPVEDCPHRALRGSIMVHPSITGTRKWFKENLYNEMLFRAQDRDLWVRTSGKGQIKKLSTPLTFKRIGSSSNRRYIEKYSESVQCAKKILNFYGPELIGARQTSIEMARLERNNWVMRGAFLLGLEKKILSRRYRHFKSGEYEHALSLLSAIKSTDI